MGKPFLMGLSFFISTISGYIAFMALYASSSLGQKDPLRVKFMREIGRVGVRGSPMAKTLHFPFPSLLSYSLISSYYVFTFLFPQCRSLLTDF
jgi:hypothetical protein